MDCVFITNHCALPAAPPGRCCSPGPQPIFGRAKHMKPATNRTDSAASTPSRRVSAATRMTPAKCTEMRGSRLWWHPLVLRLGTSCGVMEVLEPFKNSGYIRPECFVGRTRRSLGNCRSNRRGSAQLDRVTHTRIKNCRSMGSHAMKDAFSCVKRQRIINATSLHVSVETRQSGIKDAQPNVLFKKDFQLRTKANLKFSSFGGKKTPESPCFRIC